MISALQIQISGVICGSVRSPELFVSLKLREIFRIVAPYARSRKRASDKSPTSGKSTLTQIKPRAKSFCALTLLESSTKIATLATLISLH